MSIAGKLQSVLNDIERDCSLRVVDIVSFVSVNYKNNFSVALIDDKYALIIFKSDRSVLQILDWQTTNFCYFEVPKVGYKAPCIENVAFQPLN